MKLTILLTLALVACGTDSKDATPVVATETATTPDTVVPTTETPPDYFAILVTSTRALTKGKTLAAIDATALAGLSLDEDTGVPSRAYYKGLDRVTYILCKGTTTVQAYTIKSETKVILYTACADMIGEHAPELAVGDTWASKLTAEQLAYAETLKTTNTDNINGNPAKFYEVEIARFSNGGNTTDYLYSIGLCENGKIFRIYNDATQTNDRDVTKCN